MPRHIPDRQTELDRMKQEINLTEYAASIGYQLDPKSSKVSIKMRHPNGDIVVIGRSSSSHEWVFWTVGTDAPGTRGAIVNFVECKEGINNFGLIRKKLRPWLGQGASFPRPPVTAYVREVKASTADMQQVHYDYQETTPIDGHHAYLEHIRQIPAEILQSPRFRHKIRIDQYGNAIFPHHNLDGLCGFEKKNKNFTGFATGGTKGVWVSASNSSDTTLVITESAIDALSYEALFDPPRARYMSIGGEMNPTQPDILQRAFLRLPDAGKVIVATDHDDAGEKFVNQIRELVHTTRSDLTVVDHRPETPGQDWNAVLQEDTRHRSTHEK